MQLGVDVVLLPHDLESARRMAHPCPQGVYDPIKIKVCGSRVCKSRMVRAGRDLKDVQD